ncbi:hypothetical protein ACO0LL_02365 [Undibacterium sp. TC4M20W]|uniref:hypothetical protein n=1 Tax=Undibacterium sp. TC4M20W TaxID=3413052 RepID=UPI003BF33103
MLIKVSENTYVNPDAIGRLTIDKDSSGGGRRSLTTIVDMSGQNTLATISTSVHPSSYEAEKKKLLLRKDDFIHAEIVLAIKERRDIRDWETISEQEKLSYK